MRPRKSRRLLAERSRRTFTRTIIDQGLIFAVLLSLPDAIITKAFAPLLILGAFGETINGLAKIYSGSGNLRGKILAN